MKVLHVISGLRSGGAEHFLLDLCRQSRRKNLNIGVLTLGAADEMLDQFVRSGIAVLSPSKGKPKNRFTSALRGVKVLLNQEASVIHAHMFHACLIACCAKLFQPSVRVVFTLHNNYISQWHRRFLLFLTRPLRYADFVFPGMSRKWYHTRNVVAIPNGVDVRKFSDEPVHKPAVFTCLFAARLSHEKNPIFLVHLAKKLLPDHNFIIAVAGDGPLKQELIRKIAEHDLHDHFILHGRVENPVPLFASSHCVIIPSRWEGMPLVLLEAGAMGLPVIATPTGNIPFLLNDRNGYVGHLDTFPELVSEVMENYGEAVIKGRNLKRDVLEKYSISESHRLHTDVYRQR